MIPLRVGPKLRESEETERIFFIGGRHPSTTILLLIQLFFQFIKWGRKEKEGASGREAAKSRMCHGSLTLESAPKCTTTKHQPQKRYEEMKNEKQQREHIESNDSGTITNDTGRRETRIYANHAERESELNEKTNDTMMYLLPAYFIFIIIIRASRKKERGKKVAW